MGSYYDRQEAKVNVGNELARRGWTLYGYTEDRSDMMTDYFAPAHWQGVAEKDGAVVVIDNQSTYGSGGVEQVRAEVAGACPACEGTGLRADGWTLEQAKADPRAYHAHRDEGTGTVALLRNVVSPLEFKGGRETCRKCGGGGNVYKSAHYVEAWPTYQANAKGTNWHVERGGVILARGQGAGRCRVDHPYSDEGKAELARIVGAFVDKLEAAAAKGAPTPPTPKGRKEAAAPEGATWRTNAERGQVEAAFASKPAKAVREALKAAGFRWYGAGGFWYAKDTAERRALLERIAAA